MSIIPEQQLKSNEKFNLAPMVDFLFLVLALLAVVAISRVSLYEMDVNLAKINSTEGATPSSSIPEKQLVNFSITSNGSYKITADSTELILSSSVDIKKELINLCETGFILKDKNDVIFMHIDDKAPWNAIVEAIFAIKETGLSPHPVYEIAKQ